jgi:hypothetical protein
VCPSIAAKCRGVRLAAVGTSLGAFENKSGLHNSK